MVEGAAARPQPVYSQKMIIVMFSTLIIHIGLIAIRDVRSIQQGMMSLTASTSNSLNIQTISTVPPSSGTKENPTAGGGGDDDIAVPGRSSPSPQHETVDSGSRPSRPLKRAALQLPHWRKVTDCSIYSLDCMTRTTMAKPSSSSVLSLNDGTRTVPANVISYSDYPLPPTPQELNSGLWPNMTMISLLDTDDNGAMLPDWKQILTQSPLSYHPAAQEAYSGIKRSSVVSSPSSYSLDDFSSLVPPIVPDLQFEDCLERTLSATTPEKKKSTLEQLDDLLSSSKLQPDPTTQMISFTITDWNYSYDMIHDFIQMMTTIGNVAQSSILIVAIDEPTTQVACRHGYNVIKWYPPASPTVETGSATKTENGHGQNTELREAVENTK